MKTRHLIGIFAAAILPLAVSCSKEDSADVQTGEETLVSFSLAVDPVRTKGVSDGSKVDELYYAVFDAEGNYLDAEGYTGTQSVSQWPAGVEFTLSVGQTYSIVFFAWCSDCDSIYSVGGDDHKTVTVNYEYGSVSTLSNNDDGYDAFFAARTLTVSRDSSPATVTLTRPFAQVNVGFTDGTWKNDGDETRTVDKSKVTFSNVATTLDLLDGGVGGETEITFGSAAIPSGETLDVDIDGDGEIAIDGSESFIYLSMSYVLAGEERSFTNVKFTFEDSVNEDEIELDEESDSGLIPIQRNWRTNIVGDSISASENASTGSGVRIAPDRLR